MELFVRNVRPLIILLGRVRNAGVAMVGLLLVASSCKLRLHYYDDDKKAAIAALEVFHRRLSAGEFEAIYADVGGELRARPKDVLLASMKATRDQWGKLVKAEVKSTACFPGEVKMLVQAEFEKGEAAEMMGWVLPDDEKPHLQYFRIVSGRVQVPPGANECRSR
jgi:hypothetical protein